MLILAHVIETLALRPFLLINLLCDSRDVIII